MAGSENGGNRASNDPNFGPRIPKPSEYMRAKRPELFSDAAEVAEPLLEPSLLEYHLDTLTSRKQEFIFEDFCRRLAQAELCPNLKPQTGPVGGGDSKTDASTYPVAPLLIERSYWGVSTSPATEPWAFAFSCKKQWRQKVREDIAKIAGLEKRFSTAYFISSQFIKDKARDELENELTNAHGFQVHILDRSWILDVVFSHKREELAITSLGIQVAHTKTRQLGPNDTGRQIELDELLERLRAPLECYSNDYSIAADYLEAAKLARNLERPRHEVTGLFQQARKISKINGFPPQIVRCAYEHAWADNWWFDDVSTAVDVYSEIEPLLEAIEDADDVEMFANLQSLLWHGVMRQELNPDDVQLRKREDILREKLKVLSADTIRPNNALYAETMLAFLDFTVWNRGPNAASGIRRLSDCFRRSRGLATYPLKRFTDTVVGMSSFIESLEGYDDLFDTMRTVLSEREGEIAEARLLLQRGQQHLQADRSKEALRLLGQARMKAAKEEILETSVSAAILAANCYLRLGLVWAARLESLVAGQLSCHYAEGGFRSAWHGSQATRLLAWIDITQGRLGPFLRWMGIAQACFDQLADSGHDLSQLKAVYHDLETAFCDRLMLLDRETATKLTPVATILPYVGVPMARFVLLYVAGRGNEIEGEFTSVVQESVEWMRSYFEGWREQVKSYAGKTKPFIGWRDEPTCLSTEIMGVKYVIEACADFGAVAFAENLLGVLEAMLALANWENLAFIVDEIRINVDIRKEGSNPPEPRIAFASGYEQLELTWRTDVADWLATTDRQAVIEYLLSVCLAVLLHATIDPEEDLKAEMDKWQKDGVLSRALGTSPSILAVADLIGKDCYDLENCISAASLEK